MRVRREGYNRRRKMKTRDKIGSVLKAPLSWTYAVRYPAPNVMTDADTLRYIKEHRVSFARFGDGELCLMRGIGILFQEYDVRLRDRLCSLAEESVPGLLQGVPYMVSHPAKSRVFLTDPSRRFWRRHLLWAGGYYRRFFRAPLYGDTNITRFYAERRDKAGRDAYAAAVREIFAERNLLFVEGAGTHNGVGNDLFGDMNAAGRRCRRILCPSRNAYAKYDEILCAVTRAVRDDDLVVLSLGPTATVLARDLTVRGCQALDLGHLDVEYTWWQKQTGGAVPTPGKDMAEISPFVPAEKENETYLSQIIGEIQ